jgi:hypothetical protein
MYSLSTSFWIVPRQLVARGTQLGPGIEAVQRRSVGERLDRQV